MRRLAIALFAAALVTGCSSSIPRHAAVFSPTPRPTPVPTPTLDPAATPAPTADISTWVAVTGDGFSIKMPGAATKGTSSVKTPAGDATITTWTYTDANKQGYYFERVAAAPGAFAGAKAADILDQVATSIVGSIPGGQILSQSEATLNGHAGRTATIGSTETMLQCEFFIAGDDVFIADTTGSADDPLVQAFFSSFQLTA
jgi:hypothetical protein